MSDIPENGSTHEDQKSTDEKQTNRVFTQSELDTKIALAEKRAREEASMKLAEFETTKQKLAELEQIEKERREAEMTETQKLQEELKRIADERGALEAENAKLLVSQTKTKVLSDPKYITLPRAYKELVRGQTEDEIAVSANEILAEFTEDLKRTGGGKSVAVPHLDIGNTPLPDQPKTFAEQLAEKFNAKTGVFARTGR